MSLSGKAGRSVRLKPPAAYKCRNYLDRKKPCNDVIDLSASVADQVRCPRTVVLCTVPELNPVDPSRPICSDRTESVLIDVKIDVDFANVAVTEKRKTGASMELHESWSHMTS